VDDYFGLVFTTTLKITKETDYTFYPASDDVSTFYIDEKNLLIMTDYMPLLKKQSISQPVNIA